MDTAESSELAGGVPAIWPIAGYDDLTEEQRMCSEDILTALMDATKKSTGERNEIRRLLWDMVFHTRDDPWDTSLPIHKPTNSESLPAAHQRLPVGTFTQDLPPSKCTLRKTPKGKKLPEVASSRRKGQTAYLQPRYSKVRGDVEWFWCDSHGKGADLKFIDLGAWYKPKDIAVCKASALVQVDCRAHEHAWSYNTSYAAYLMRRRLARVAIDQQPQEFVGQRSANPTVVDFAAFREPLSLEDIIMRTPSTGESGLIQHHLQARRNNHGSDRAPLL